MAKRTDVHRPGAIIPVDYSFVLWYSCATTIEGWPQPAINITCTTTIPAGTGPGQGQIPMRVAAPHREDGRCCVMALQANFPFQSVGPGKCSVCGAWFIYGEVWRHDPTGVHIHIGHDCAEKYSMLRDRQDMDAWRAEQRQLRATDQIRKERQEARQKYLTDRPQLASALEMDHEILKDMSRKLTQYGSLSEKQIAFALRLASEITNPPEPERHIQAPEGRQKIQGTVVGVRDVESDFGTTTKMTIKVVTPEGSWLCWVTCPDALLGNQPLRGSQVELTATLVRSDRDQFFAFGKRPTKARFVLSELAQEHQDLVHCDGSVCEDGCDKAPVAKATAQDAFSFDSLPSVQQ